MLVMSLIFFGVSVILDQLLPSGTDIYYLYGKRSTNFKNS